MHPHSVLTAIIGTVVLGGCGSPVVKSAAIDPAVVARSPLPASYLTPRENGEFRLTPTTGWMADVDPVRHLTFAGYRTDGEVVRFGVVLVCDPANDRLHLLLLDEHESPLDALANPDRRRRLERFVQEYAANPTGLSLEDGDRVLELSLERLIATRRLAPPVPEPRHVLAVAANYPSHLTHDLAVEDPEQYRPLASQTRARVFLKYPVIAPPGVDPGSLPQFEGIIGPFDDVRYPRQILIPPAADSNELRRTETAVDYEVELGVVIGQSLDWSTVQSASDDELRDAIAGLVLVSDAKARNPQVLQKVRSHDKPLSPDNLYRFEDTYLDHEASIWNETTAQWWSYAASWGSYTAIGPFFVAAAPDLKRRPRAMASARSYAVESERGLPPPKGRETDTLFLRQASVTTTDHSYHDALLWDVPEIIRSIVQPGGALNTLMDGGSLAPGDIICLGTPGGTVITGRSYRLFDFLEGLVFFWRPINWHDSFFERSRQLYLRNGDQLFLWMEGLGYQLLTLEEVEVEFGD